MMRRVVCLVLTLLLCASLTVSVMAAETSFTPSVSAKDHPTIETVKDEKGNPAVGTVSGGVKHYVANECLLLTSVAEAKKPSDQLENYDKEAHDLLLDVYKQLNAGEMKIPFEKFGLDPNKVVVRDLFDASWLCVDWEDLSDHPEQMHHEDILAPEGTVLNITFDLGVSAKDKVHVFTYKHHDYDKTGEKTWGEIVDTKNNGDGTVTCTFEHLCVVAICLETDGTTTGTGATVTTSKNWVPKTGDLIGQNLYLWIALVAASAVALVAVVVVNNKKKKH